MSHWEERMQQEISTFMENVDSMTRFLMETEQEIQGLEQTKQALLQLREKRKQEKKEADGPETIVERCASVAKQHLAQQRNFLAGRDKKKPELKLLHRLTIATKPAPMCLPVETDTPAGTPAVEKKKRFFDAIFSKKESDQESGSTPVTEGADGEATFALAPEKNPTQGTCRIGVKIDPHPGDPYGTGLRELMTIKCAVIAQPDAVLIGLEKDPALPNELLPQEQISANIEAAKKASAYSVASLLAQTVQDKFNQALDYAAKVLTSKHSKEAADVASAAAGKGSGYVTDEDRETAVKFLRCLCVKAKAEPLERAQVTPARSPVSAVHVDPVPTQAERPCHYCCLHLTLLKLPERKVAQVVDKVVEKLKKEHAEHMETLEKSVLPVVENVFSIFDLLGTQHFRIFVDAGICTAVPPPPDDTAHSLEKQAESAVNAAWAKHKEGLQNKEALRDTMQEVAKKAAGEVAKRADNSLELVEGKARDTLAKIRPLIAKAVDRVALPCARRTIVPEMFPPTSTFPPDAVAFNVYRIEMERAPRELMKILLYSLYDTLAGQDVGPQAQLRIAASKVKVSGALATFDDLHFDVATIPFTKPKDKACAATIMEFVDDKVTAEVTKVGEKLAATILKLVQEEHKRGKDFLESKGYRTALEEQAAGSAGALIKPSHLEALSSFFVAALSAFAEPTGSSSFASSMSGDQPASSRKEALSDEMLWQFALCTCTTKSPLEFGIVVPPPPSLRKKQDSQQGASPSPSPKGAVLGVFEENCGTVEGSVHLQVSVQLQPTGPNVVDYSTCQAAQCQCWHFNDSIRRVIAKAVMNAANALAKIDRIGSSPLPQSPLESSQEKS